MRFLLLFTNKKSFQSISFSLQGKQGNNEGHPLAPIKGPAHTYCMSVWTWSCRCWGSCGPPCPGAMLRKL